MQSKELRLAIVLYGGVSLAIYMHGVTREVLNLIRASKALQRKLAGAGKRFPRAAERETDTETIYFDMLAELLPGQDLRVVVDIIAGASAGGVNGVMLARALAHDLPLDAHRELWLKNADVTRLVDEKASSGRFGKIYLTPILYGVLGRRLRALAPEAETREKLTGFIRSRWFKPPFSGRRYLGWMLDACRDMGSRRRGSLVPVGHALDLFVTLTDFHGHLNRIELHDPVEIDEREHRRIVRFTCRRLSDGAIESQLDEDHVPSLVFSARATSSFPGAFPPATISELERVLDENDQDWPGRDSFLQQLASEEDDGLGSRPFIDGSVIMNKPFAPTIDAVSRRPAQRQVIRRLIYVDPSAGNAPKDEIAGRPGFFRTILASLARIPRNEPIADDLARIAARNRQVRRLGEVIAAAEPDVEALVDEIVGDTRDLDPTLRDVAIWRKRANNAAAEKAGYAYQSYIRLKIRSVLERLATLAADLSRRGGGKVRTDALVRRMVRWAETEDIVGGRFATHYGTPSDRGRLRKIDFLKEFDADFRVRRLRFVIRRINRLYRSRGHDWLDTERLDRLKAELYGVLEGLEDRWNASDYDEDAVAVADRIVAGLDGRDAPAVADAVEVFGDTLNLVAFDRRVDEIFNNLVLDTVSPPVRHAITTAYIGFAFFDVLTLPMMQWDDLREFQEILVDRISPLDVRELRPSEDKPLLKCTSLQNFAGFFNRSYREHDYLWGRLNAADRLVDIVLQAAGLPADVRDARAVELKPRLFRAILRAEAPHLDHIDDLVADIEAKLRADEGSMPDREQPAV